MQRISRVIAAIGAAALLVGGAILGGASAPASAAGGTFAWTTPPITAQFTESWTATATYTDPTNSLPCYSTCAVTMRLDGPVSFESSAEMFRSVTPGVATAVVSPFWAPNLPGVLPPGDYTVTLTYVEPYSGIQSVSSPLAVTITPAELTFALTTLADPAVPTALILSTTLTTNIDNPYIGITPGGTWTLSAVDESGTEVLTREIEQETNGYQLWGSTYWADPPPATKLTFTIDATGTGSEYEVTGATTTLTTAGAPAPPPTTEPTPPPDEAAAAVGAAVPVWVFIVAGLLVAVAIVTIIVVLVRRRRGSRRPVIDSAPGEESAESPIDHTEEVER